MKRLNYLFGILLFTSMLASCEEHIEPIDYSLKVGNILLSDDRIIPPAAWDSTQQKAAGIIFGVKNDTAYAVGLKELGTYSYCDSTATVSNVNSDATNLDGLANTASLLVFASTNGVKVPAATIASSYVSGLSGWYLPSCGELQLLAKNLETVKTSLELVKGDSFSDAQYISSSQDGTNSSSEQLYCFSVSLNQGYVTSTLKTEKHKVRPVIIIR